MNEVSSRSHTIFRLVVESKECAREEGEEVDEAVLVASLNLVDLAGSESVRHSGTTGQRAKEGGKINQSLLSLSRVIHALSQQSKTHVPYRDSKLTQLLQPSLSGNAKMCVICCITSADRYVEETRSTLQFASRAKLVTTNATVNEVLDEAALLRRLQRELLDLKSKQAVNKQPEDADTLNLEIQRDDLLRRLEALQADRDSHEVTERLSQ
jgi:centromeric protein E